MFQFKPRADLKDKNIAILASIFTTTDKYQQTLDVLKSVVDTVIEETTCRVLKVIQSISNPDHFMLYEEWSDYDEFFTIQLKRDYRQGFAEKLDGVRNKSSTFEFFEILSESGKLIETEFTGQDKYTCVVTHLWLKEERREKLENVVSALPELSEAVDTNQSCKLFRSLNDPLLFVIYHLSLDSEHSPGMEKNYVIPFCFSEFFNNDVIEMQQVEFFQTRYIPI